jgi:hypothetical protein
MIKKAGKQGANGGGPDDKLEKEIDALFTLPLAEFTSARNTLAASLKKEGRANDADRVKLLSKPSVSAWAVNQLYWDHRDAFDELIFASKHFRPASTRLAGRVAGMRDSLDARREALTNLSELAAEILTGAGHNPSPDTMRRVLTTLEALSGYALLPDGPTPGRLTNDVDPPSFESLALLMSGAGPVRETEPAPSRKSDKSREKANSAEVRRIEEFRQKKIAAAKASLQEAKTSLSAARARVQSSETAQKKASAQLKEAEKQKRQVESLLKKATGAYDDAASRAESAEAEAREAAREVENAKRNVDEATKELESLLRK